MGAEPKDGVVTPENLFATIFHCLGLGADSMFYDQLNRPHHIVYGEPVKQII